VTDETTDTEVSAPTKRSWLAWAWVAIGIVLAAVVATAAFSLLLGKQVQVPTITGMTLPEAQRVVTAAGLKISDITIQSGSNAPEGSIIAQAPGPGVQVRQGSSVTIVIAAVLHRVTVPNVVGLSSAAAGRAIAAAGLTAQITRAYSDSTPQDTVIGQSPASGNSALLNSPVAISISIGPQSTTVTMPDVSGMSQADAASRLASLGLTVRSASAYSATIATGQVVQSVPAAAKQVAPGTTVGLDVSAGAPTGNPTDMPNLTGSTSAQAIAELGDLGLTYSRYDWDGTGVPANQVVAQIPLPGEQTAGGSVVVFVSSGR